MCMIFFYFFFDMSNWCGSERFVIFFISIMLRNSHVDAMAKHWIEFNEFASSVCLMFKSIVHSSTVFAGTPKQQSESPAISIHNTFISLWFSFSSFQIRFIAWAYTLQQANFTFINFLKLLNICRELTINFPQKKTINFNVSLSSHFFSFLCCFLLLLLLFEVFVFMCYYSSAMGPKPKERSDSL